MIKERREKLHLYKSNCKFKGNNKKNTLNYISYINKLSQN